METKIIQITSGRGPAECCWVVAQVLKIFLQEAREKGYTAVVLWREKGMENGTLLSATVELKGKSMTPFLQQWLGTVQWVGQSQFRKFHKRKNWFVGVAEVPMDHSFSVSEREMVFKATRAGGPGGQHVNKVSTAIRATHLPTGVSVLASDSRSQHQNKKNARERLINLLQAKRAQAQLEQVRSSWQNHNELQRGNPVRVFTGLDFKPKPVKKSNKALRRKSKNDLKNRMDEND